MNTFPSWPLSALALASLLHAFKLVLLAHSVLAFMALAHEGAPGVALELSRRWLANFKTHPEGVERSGTKRWNSEKNVSAEDRGGRGGMRRSPHLRLPPLKQLLNWRRSPHAGVTGPPRALRGPSSGDPRDESGSRRLTASWSRYASPRSR
jgi:hypothetical protein